jgi:hypothetical protein
LFSDDTLGFSFYLKEVCRLREERLLSFFKGGLFSLDSMSSSVVPLEPPPLKDALEDLRRVQILEELEEEEDADEEGGGDADDCG